MPTMLQARRVFQFHHIRIMANNSVEVKLIGSDEDGGFVALDDFTAFCRSLMKCLKRSDDIVRPEGERLRYRITRMYSNSAALTIEPIRPVGGNNDHRAIVQFFKDTVSRLQHGKTPDRRLTFDDLEAFCELVTPIQKHSKEVWISGTRLTTEYVAHIEGILGNAIPSHGRVSGRLERVNIHGKNEFIHFPPAGGRITCAFENRMFDDVRRGLRGMVTVEGTLYFQPDKPFPDRVRVDKMEIHPPDDKLPKLKDLKGLAKKCTGKLSAVEFVRALRDE